MTTLKNAWHHIRRSPLQSLASVIIIWFLFFISTIFVFVSNGMANVLAYFETKPEITIFLKDGLDKNTIENIQKDLSNYPEVREIKFISKETALNIYREQNKNNPLLLEMVTASILPASFEVSVSNPETLSLIATNFSSKTQFVDEIIYQKDLVQSLLNWTKNIRIFGIITVSVLGLIAFLVMSVLIGLKITNRKDEVKVSRLLGASSFYVKKPFLLEGLIYGSFGSFIGWLIAFIIAIYLRPSINLFFDPTTFLPTSISFYFYVLAIEMFIGALLGYLSSYFGVRRYIKSVKFY